MRNGGIVALTLLCALVVACPGSGTVTEADAGAGTFGSPTLTWAYQPDVRTPVTTLAECVESVLACVEAGTALGDCFGGPVSVCPGAEPADGCCMPACGDQVEQALAAGTTEYDAFLEVFVYDRTCMPGIAELLEESNP